MYVYVCICVRIYVCDDILCNKTSRLKNSLAAVLIIPMT